MTAPTSGATEGPTSAVGPSTAGRLGGPAGGPPAETPADLAPRAHRPVPRRRVRTGLARFPLRTTLRATAAAAVVLLVAALVGGTIVIAGQDDARDLLVDRLDPALLASQQLARSAVDQENGLRGYVLTGRPEFLAPYEQARAEQRRTGQALRGLLADEPAARADLDAVDGRLQAWRDAYATPTVAAAGGAATAGAAPPPSAEVGGIAFEAVRGALAGQQQRLGALRADARSALSASAATLTWFAAVVACGLALIVALLLLWLRYAVLGPTTHLAREVRGVVVGDLGRRVEVDGPREIVELGEDVDAMRELIARELAASEEARQELDVRGRELARSNSDLEQFAYVASHDLQEPLRKVASFCQLLERRYAGQLDERADQYIGFAVDGAKRMQALINDLLAFSRVGRAPGTVEEVDLGVLVDQAARNVDEPRQATGGRITHDALPTVAAETSLLTSVFQNLFTNSLKFHGDEAPHVHVTAGPGTGEHAGRWLVRVRDNGIGIDPEYAERVFVIFQRLHSKAAYPGTGIGLAMSHKIVEHHGGTMWLASPPTDGGPGTEFVLTLPVAVPTPTPPVPEDPDE